MNGIRNAQGAFKLVIVVGKATVPAHTGTVPRSRARQLQKLYRQHRPNATTRVVKAVQ